MNDKKLQEINNLKRSISKTQGSIQTLKNILANNGSLYISEESNWRGNKIENRKILKTILTSLELELETLNFKFQLM